jgi:hypothetical protein
LLCNSFYFLIYFNFVTAKEVSKVWRNIRDAYARTNRKIEEDKTSGAGVLLIKKYVYSEQLKFLLKVDYCERETGDSIDTDISPEENSKLPSAHHETSGEETSDQEAATFKKPSPRMGTKKRRNCEPDEIEMKMLAALENDKPNSLSLKVSFPRLKSLTMMRS